MSNINRILNKLGGGVAAIAISTTAIGEQLATVILIVNRSLIYNPALQLSSGMSLSDEI